MFRFKGTIFRPNTKTQFWHIQRVHPLWDPTLFTIVLALKFMTDVFKMYICNKLLSVCHS